MNITGSSRFGGGTSAGAVSVLPATAVFAAVACFQLANAATTELASRAAAGGGSAGFTRVGTGTVLAGGGAGTLTTAAGAGALTEATGLAGSGGGATDVAGLTAGM